jgi:hypothetical protein
MRRTTGKDTPSLPSRIGEPAQRLHKGLFAKFSLQSNSISVGILFAAALPQFIVIDLIAYYLSD